MYAYQQGNQVFRVWVEHQNKWRRALARGDFSHQLLRILEMRLAKANKRANIMEVGRSQRSAGFSFVWFF